MRAELFVGWRYLGRTKKERFFSLVVLPLFVVATGFLGFFIYLAAKRKDKFISLFSISIVGIALGVMALITVIAVMSGFDKDLREKIVGNYAHINMTGFGPINTEESEALIKKISAVKHVIGAAPYISGQILLKDDKRFYAVGIKGIDPQRETHVTKLNEYLRSGSLSGLNAGGIIIGGELAGAYGLRVGSKVNFISPQGKESSLDVAGIFTSGMYDYDMNLVFVNIGSAQAIMGLKDQVSGLAVKLDDLHLTDKVRNELSGILGFNYDLRTWMEMNRNFFAALKLEKLTMFIILTLIILVASFNIISTLIVLVVDKTKEIGILKSFGMTRSSVRRLFISIGLIVGGVGTLLGTAGGIGLCALLKKYQFIKLPQDIYYIDRLPVSIQLWPDVGLVIIAALAITLISTVYPAAKAADLKPVDALRYE